MLVLRSPEQASRIADPELRNLVKLRFAQVCSGETYDPDRHGYVLVVEPGDTVQTIERQSGCPVMTDTFREARFGDAEFTPATEVIEEHRNCYELVFIFTDDGYVIEIFVPKVDGVDSDPSAMCRQFAVPARDVAQQ